MPKKNPGGNKLADTEALVVSRSGSPIQTASSANCLAQEQWIPPKTGKVRKRKPRRFTKVISIYVSANQFDGIKHRANGRRQTISRHCRLAVLRAAKRSLPVALEGEVLSQVESAAIILREKLADISPRSATAKAMHQALHHLDTVRNAIRQANSGPTKSGTKP